MKTVWIIYMIATGGAGTLSAVAPYAPLPSREACQALLDRKVNDRVIVASDEAFPACLPKRTQ